MMETADDTWQMEHLSEEMSREPRSACFHWVLAEKGGSFVWEFWTDDWKHREAHATLIISDDCSVLRAAQLWVRWAVDVKREMRDGLSPPVVVVVHSHGSVQVGSLAEADAVIESTIIPAHKLAVRRAEAAITVGGDG